MITIKYRFKSDKPQALDLLSGFQALGIECSKPEKCKRLYQTRVLVSMPVNLQPMPETFWDFISKYATAAKLDMEYLKVMVVDPNQAQA